MNKIENHENRKGWKLNRAERKGENVMSKIAKNEIKVAANANEVKPVVETKTTTTKKEKVAMKKSTKVVAPAVAEVVAPVVEAAKPAKKVRAKKVVAPVAEVVAPVVAEPTKKVRAKREKVEVVFTGKKGITFTADAELTTAVNTKTKKEKVMKTKAPKVEAKVEAPKAPKAKREKVDVVFEGKRGIVFTADKALTKEVNRKGKAKKVAEPVVEKVETKTKSARQLRREARAAKRAEVGTKAEKVAPITGAKVRRSMKELGKIVETISATTDAKKAKKVAAKYIAEVGAETAAKNIKFILKRLNNTVATELFGQYRKAA